MKKSNYYLLLILVISTVLLSFTLPSRLEKKVKKEIKKTFKVENFQLVSINVSTEVNLKLSKEIKNQLFKIEKDSTLIGYAYIDKAPSKTDEFDYLILLNKDLIVAKTKILIYREDYGGEIGSKRWLKQFIGKNASNTLKYEKDIIAISGATISASSMTIAINTFLQNLSILHKNNVL